MKQNKKNIIIISDYQLNSGNSVSTIIKNLLNFKCLKNYNAYILINDESYSLEYEVVKEQNYNHILFKHRLTKTSILVKKTKGFSRKIKIIFSRAYRFVVPKLNKDILWSSFNLTQKVNYISAIFEPELIIACVGNPLLKPRNLNSPIIHILYDPFLGRPYTDFKFQYKVEKKAIKESIAYFVPSYCFDVYSKNYKNFSTLYRYDLPLLLDIQVVNAYLNKISKNNFVYFGQLQDFRNINLFSKFILENKIYLECYTYTNVPDVIKNNPYVTINDVVIGDEYIRTLADAKFTIILDNNPPYENYLPSKVYDLVSFCKPIIVFTKNTNSAILRFLNNYPYLCVLHYGDTNLYYNLTSFINKYKDKELFDINVYNKYSSALPEKLEMKFMEVLELR